MSRLVLLEPLLESRISGIEEAIRSYGQQRIPYAILSRSVAGTIGNTLDFVLRFYKWR
jgi:molybdopterin biosynthesis enzyme MoaB